MITPAPLPRGTILVVDDQEVNTTLVETILAPQGYEIILALDGERALELVTARSPDLILLDVIMPGMSGFEVCARLKQDERTRLIPIVMITSLSDLQDRIRGIEVGADDFLSKPFHPAELSARVRSLLKLKQITDELEDAEDILCTLALSVEAKDAYTDGHCERLSRYSVALGRSLGLPLEQLKALHRGGYLHDVGKIAVPESILNKRSELTEEESRIIREHPIIGERICKPLKSLKFVLPIIRHHHERWDGSGYPDGLQGEEIPLAARIIQAVDIYDALMTARPYKPQLESYQVVSIMRQASEEGSCDPRLVEQFIDLLQSGKTLVGLEKVRPSRL
ncbi:metal-dependent phosphohydrolase [Candidatus Methylomirabilis lanthanidiphila]|uniref:Metal-dependent phosphohydrolase n=1 Tax=Candidatus Methylomirabilis lanthanidiphila TaxID=2211376 RepID=A0A564ZN90_9BACT|nr:response regulator [Candidatus Methylomirabilis lanthanidiphila]VUZ86112.1 metal-dependent phosphohydrolase [Candidatus Methylomirabilis lanthanidiphila]